MDDEVDPYRYFDGAKFKEDLPRSPFSFTQLAECAERELHSRKSRYPGYIARHRMSQDMADSELEKMQAIGVLLRALAKSEMLV